MKSVNSREKKGMNQRDWWNSFRLVSKKYTKRCQLKNQIKATLITTIVIMRLDQNLVMLAFEILGVSAIWSQCSSNSTWLFHSGILFWWLRMASHNALLKRAQNKSMIICIISSEICLHIFCWQKSKNITLRIFVFRLKIFKVSQWMSLFSKMPKNSWISFLIK